MEWFFDGLGTELVSMSFGLFLGAGAGGIAGYKIGINKSVLKQNQEAGTDSKQMLLFFFRILLNAFTLIGFNAPSILFPFQFINHNFIY